jgi:hypothetical protein
VRRGDWIDIYRRRRNGFETRWSRFGNVIDPVIVRGRIRGVR